MQPGATAPISKNNACIPGPEIQADSYRAFNAAMAWSGEITRAYEGRHSGNSVAPGTSERRVSDERELRNQRFVFATISIWNSIESDMVWSATKS